MRNSKSDFGGSTCNVIVEGELYEVDRNVCSDIIKRLREVTQPRKVVCNYRFIREWKQSEIDLLGKITDGSVAEKTGFSQAAVGRKRRDLGIPACSSRGAKWRREWSEEELALLGKMTDSEVAEKLNLSISTIGIKRKELGIDRFRKPSRVWNEEEVSLLGTMTDREVAEKLGIHQHVVTAKRRELGILAHNRHEFEEEAPREIPRLTTSEMHLANEIYALYENAKTLVQAVNRIKKFTSRKNEVTLSRVSEYLAAKHQNNFPLERCLTLVGIF